VGIVCPVDTVVVDKFAFANILGEAAWSHTHTGIQQCGMYQTISNLL